MTVSPKRDAAAPAATAHDTVSASTLPKGLSMRLVRPPAAEALMGLRAMKTVAMADGAIAAARRTLMETARDVVLGISADIDALPEIDPARFAEGFPDPLLRRQFVNGLLVLALADGTPSPAVTKAVAAFAEALGVEGPELTDLRRLTEGQMLLFKLDFLRRSQVGDIMRDQLDQHGLLGLAKGILGMRGLIEDPELAARYRAWERLPKDSLGYAMLAYYDGNGFGMPGERGGFPEAGVYHDFSHVLAGYGTDPTGEIEVAAFTSGYKRHRPFYVMLFAVMIFSAGINVRPTANSGVTRTGILGDPDVARRMFAALERGATLNVDLADKWDYWPYVEMPVGEVRRRLGIAA